MIHQNADQVQPTATLVLWVWERDRFRPDKTRAMIDDAELYLMSLDLDFQAHRLAHPLGIGVFDCVIATFHHRQFAIGPCPIITPMRPEKLLHSIGGGPDYVKITPQSYAQHSRLRGGSPEELRFSVR
jgi:hypothetical protein